MPLRCAHDPVHFRTCCFASSMRLRFSRVPRSTRRMKDHLRILKVSASTCPYLVFEIDEAVVHRCDQRIGILPPRYAGQKGSSRPGIVRYIRKSQGRSSRLIGGEHLVSGVFAANTSQIRGVAASDGAFPASLSRVDIAVHGALAADRDQRWRTRARDRAAPTRDYEPRWSICPVPPFFIGACVWGLPGYRPCWAVVGS